MNKGLTLISGIGLGAGLMYILDPDKGNRRRALARDKVMRALNKSGDAVGATSRDIVHRMRGLFAEMKHLLKSEEAETDVLLARLRSKMGRVVSHPGSINITVKQGRVTLSGPILANEVDDLLKCVSKVRGVTGIETQLEVHKEAGDIPGLQGGVDRPGYRFELIQTNWSPTVRLLVGAAGSALAFYGVKRQDPIGSVLGILGIGMLARGLTNMEVKRLIGVGAGRRAVDIQKNINIAAPVEYVFDFWRHFENFPRFMTNVREVRDLGEGRSHWVVAGPAGVPVKWDAVVTRMIPNELLAWKTEENPLVEHAGIVRFMPNADGSTNIDVKLSYNPIAGAIGHVVATLFGADAKTEMDQDLMRMKSLIETGIPPHDAAERGPIPQMREATAR